MKFLSVTKLVSAHYEKQIFRMTNGDRHDDKW